MDRRSMRRRSVVQAFGAAFVAALANIDQVMRGPVSTAMAGNASKRRKRERRQRRFCKEVARRASAGGTQYCESAYQFDPARIGPCITAYNACVVYTRRCKASAAKACYAAFHTVW